MEGQEEHHNSGTVSLPLPVVVVGEEGNFSGSTVAPPPPAEALVGAATPGSDGFKKKRGRPRKYGPDGKPKVTLSPMPISSSIPLSGDFPGWKQKQEKPVTSVKRKQKLEFRTSGAQVASSIGANFTPHVITVNSGEDVNMKIISFAQQGTKAICVLAANGAVSNVTLGQPNASGGTLTYEGRFDILCLSGAFTPNESGGAKGWCGGMSVSLAGPDGRVLGGGLSGMLVAAGPVQVILGSFLTNQQQEQQRPKKSRFEPFATTPFFKETYGDEPNISFTLTNPRSLDPERNGSLHVSEPNTSQFEVSC
ncbi:hypothetical protein LXL04_035323 [Taraxacum kok-saghyz]